MTSQQTERAREASPIERLAEHLAARPMPICSDDMRIMLVADWLDYSLNRCGLVVVPEQSLASEEAVKAVARAPFQERVGDWMQVCFTPEIIADKLERADRFIEEALELVQSTGYSAERAHALVDYVFNRPVGEPFQEVGGVTVTLAALCNTHGINVEEAAEAELARVWTKIEKIRAKQGTKPVGSSLPVPIAAMPSIPQESDAEVTEESRR